MAIETKIRKRCETISGVLRSLQGIAGDKGDRLSNYVYLPERASKSNGQNELPEINDDGQAGRCRGR